MDGERFKALIAAYGASPQRWPAAERAAALEMIAAEPTALGEARALDRSLDVLAADAPARLSEAFVSSALSGFPAPQIVRFPQRARVPAGALAACAMLGVLIGVAAGAVAPTDGADRSVAAAFGGALDVDGDDANG